MCRTLQTAGAALVGALGIAGLMTGTVSSAQEAAPRPQGCVSGDAVNLVPLSGRTVALGQYVGVAYYTAEIDGYRVVVTVAPGEAGAPIRFVSMLADRQNLVVSVPQAVGSPALEVEFQRCGDAVFVNERDGLAAAPVEVSAERLRASN